MAKVLGIFGFLQFGLADVLDIGMVALLIFFLLRSIRGESTVVNIVLVLALLVAAQAIASALNMRMMTVLLNAILDVGVLAIIIIFQPEIRHLLNRFAMQTGISRRTGDLFNKILGIKEERLGSHSVEELAEAVRAMSAEKTGALIVIQHKSSMEEFIETGDRFDAEINRRLIMNIFFKNSPLHDGAMIIIGNHIAAARCQLPMTNRTDIPAHFGMRHRAAIGLSEDTDADIIVVSEESGAVRFVRSGEAVEVSSMQELRQLLGRAMDSPKDASETPKEGKEEA
ncbi:MAG: diadenylate cyclase [Bacteroidales bacterium]|nr:diadenylate cyclase [Bacteroidales bacterium]MBR0052926.1 diadenylate cyclase [Bacteroidales bacterium]